MFLRVVVSMEGSDATLVSVSPRPRDVTGENTSYRRLKKLFVLRNMYWPLIVRYWDCQEGEDEEDCVESAATSLPMCQRLESDSGECHCPPDTRKCDNNLCLGHEKWCNSVSECGDMSDEPATCTTCLGRISLTNQTKLCDNVADCPDLSDETPTSCGCPEQSWRCDAGNWPIRSQYLQIWPIRS